MTAGRNMNADRIAELREELRLNVEQAATPAPFIALPVSDLAALLDIAERAVEPEVSALDAMRARLADGTVRRHAEEAARKAHCNECRSYECELDNDHAGSCPCACHGAP